MNDLKAETLVERRPWVLHPAFRWSASVLVVVLFAGSFFLPVWQSRFVAPQYPYGLHMEVYMDHVMGDTFEVDILNHYVGMRPIEKMATFERSLALPSLALVIGLALAAAAFRSPRWYFLLSLPILLFPVGMIGDLLGWLYYAGHALDPTSQLSMSVKPFMPKLIGYQKIANFDVWSTLGWGTWLQLSGVLLFVAYFVFYRRAAKRYVA